MPGRKANSGKSNCADLLKIMMVPSPHYVGKGCKLYTMCGSICFAAELRPFCIVPWGGSDDSSG